MGWRPGKLLSTQESSAMFGISSIFGVQQQNLLLFAISLPRRESQITEAVLLCSSAHK